MQKRYNFTPNVSSLRMCTYQIARDAVLSSRSVVASFKLLRNAISRVHTDLGLASNRKRTLDTRISLSLSLYRNPYSSSRYRRRARVNRISRELSKLSTFPFRDRFDVYLPRGYTRSSCFGDREVVAAVQNICLRISYRQLTKIATVFGIISIANSQVIVRLDMYLVSIRRNVQDRSYSIELCNRVSVRKIKSLCILRYKRLYTTCTISTNEIDRSNRRNILNESDISNST